jgi:hypothetical protein
LLGVNMRTIHAGWLLVFPLTVVSLFAVRTHPPAVGQSPAQQPTEQAVRVPSRYMDEAIVQHGDGSAVLKANNARPLKQAIEALNEEYGWIIDYEDPPYRSDFDLIDKTTAAHRAADANFRFRVPAGNGFQVTYPEDSSITTLAGQDTVIRRVVSAYNDSGNPGRFDVLSQGRGRQTVLGVSIKNEIGQFEHVTPVLNTNITIPLQERTVHDTIVLILREVSAANSTKVALGWVPLNFFNKKRVTVGGANLPARTLLIQTFNATSVPVVYNLMYFDSGRSYLLGAQVGTRALRDTFGRKKLMAISLPPA